MVRSLSQVEKPDHCRMIHCELFTQL